MKMLLLFVATAAAAQMPACPPNSQEQQIASMVSKRKALKANGDIEKLIRSNGYNTADLTNDAHDLWLFPSMDDQDLAIQSFVDTLHMDQAEQKASSHDWLSVVLGWSTTIFALAEGPEAFIIQYSLALLTQGLATIKEAAQTAASKTTDFSRAAVSYRSQIPSQRATLLNNVEDFVNDIRLNYTDRENYVQRMLAAYDHVTNLIGNRSSYRKLFNEYYHKFHQSAIPTPSNANYFVRTTDQFGTGRTSLVFSVSPTGMNACEAIGTIMDINDGCFSSASPGISAPGVGEFKVIVGKEHGEKEHVWAKWSGYQFDCAAPDVDHPEGIWGFISTDSGSGQTYTKQGNVFQSDRDWVIKGLQEIAPMCAKTVTMSTPITGVNWISDGLCEQCSGKDFWHGYWGGLDIAIRDHPCKLSAQQKRAADNSTLLVV